MTDPIAPELFNHLVQLAALELAADEAEYLRGQLNNQLKAIHELELIPVDPGTPIAAHGVPYTASNSQPARPDHWQPYPNPLEILEQAPEIDERYIIVPEIPHTELD
jgi:aspartyl-tRNA(Asn)/glutamyl-tRNA(Gln) amidotransferase subunit C